MRLDEITCVQGGMAADRKSILLSSCTYVLTKPRRDCETDVQNPQSARRTRTGLKTWVSCVLDTKCELLAMQVAVSSLSPVSIHI